MREEVKDVLEGKKFRLEEMQENLKVMEDSVDKFKNWKWIQELKNEIDDLDSEIQEIESEYIDLYSLHMDRKLYNKIFAFEVPNVYGSSVSLYRIIPNAGSNGSAGTRAETPAILKKAPFKSIANLSLRDK